MSEEKEKSGLLHKLAKPFKSHSSDSSDSKTSKLSAYEEEIVQKAYAEGKSKAEREAHSKTLNVSGTTAADSSVLQQAYNEGHSKGTSSNKNSAVDQAYYEGKSQGYADNTTSSDPNVIASTSTGKVLSTPPRINRKPVERETGDFANQKNPIDQDVVYSSSAHPEASAPGVAGTKKSTSRNHNGIEENSNPMYTDESEVKEGTGYYYNPKDTQGGIYNNQDASDYSEATKASLPVKRDLKTEPTGSSSSEPQLQSETYSNPSAQAHSHSDKDFSNKNSNEGKSYGKETVAAGFGAGAAIVGAEKYSQNKNSTPSDYTQSKNSDYDSEIAKLDKQIDSTQKDIDALSAGKYANNSENASINAVYNEPLTSRNKSPTQEKYSSGEHSNSGATYLGRVSGNDRIVPPNSNSSLDPKLASTQPTPTPAGHGVTSKSEKPGVLDGAKGAVAGAGVAAASALGYDAYKSHSDTTKTNSNKDILDQSYDAGQQSADKDASRYVGSSSEGIIGSSPEVYGSSKVANTSSTSGSQANTGKIEKPHLDNIDNSSSHNTGYLAGVTGALGSAAAAIGFGGRSDSAQHETLGNDNTTAGTSKRDTPIVQSNSGSGLGSALGLGSASSNVVELTSDTRGEVNSSNKGTAIGGISAALGGAAAAVGASSYSSKDKSNFQSSNDDSLVETAARKYPEVDEQPAYASKRGTSKTQENIESKPSDEPSQSNAKNSRDLESEVVAHNKKVGVKNDDRSLLQIAQDHSADVRNEPAFKGKGSVLDRDDDVIATSTVGDVQEVPEEVFQNQNEFIRSGGKRGNLHDDPTNSVSNKSTSSHTAVGGTTSGYSHHETKPLPDVNELSHKTNKENSTSGSDEVKSGGILGTGLLGGVFGSKSSNKHNNSDNARPDSGLENAKSSPSSKLSEKETKEYYLEGIKRGSYEAGQVQATEDFTKDSGSSKDYTNVSGSSKSSTGSKVAGAAVASGLIGGVGSAGHRENSNLANTSSSGSRGAAQRSNDDNLTVEVIGVEDRGKASEIAHQASKELLNQGVDLSSGKLVVDTNNKEIYKIGTSSAGGAPSTKSDLQSGNTQVPPVGLDKGIGNKYHSEHEAAKAKLEKAAEHGDLGNIGEQPTSHGSSHGSSHGAAVAGGAAAAGGAAVSGGSAAGRSVSDKSSSQKPGPAEILVTVKGTKDPAEATIIANKAVESLSDRPEILANAKELKIDTDSGIVTNEAGKKLFTSSDVSTTSAKNTSYGYERQGLEHTESSDSIPRTVPSETDGFSSLARDQAGTDPATSASKNATSKYNTSAQAEQPVHMPGAFP